MVAHLQLHILHLPIVGVKLGICGLLVLYCLRLLLGYLVMHHVENVLVLSLLIEHSVVEFIRVNQAPLQSLRLPLERGFRLVGCFRHGFDHVSADHFYARFDIVPIELVDLVRPESVGQLLVA